MVRKELKGKDQAPCQDFKKKKCTIIEQLFFFTKEFTVFTEESSGSSP